MCFCPNQICCALVFMFLPLYFWLDHFLSLFSLLRVVRLLDFDCVHLAFFSWLAVCFARRLIFGHECMDRFHVQYWIATRSFWVMDQPWVIIAVMLE